MTFFLFFFLKKQTTTRPELTLCGLQDVKIQLATNFKKMLALNYTSYVSRPRTAQVSRRRSGEYPLPEHPVLCEHNKRNDPGKEKQLCLTLNRSIPPLGYTLFRMQPAYP